MLKGIDISNNNNLTPEEFETVRDCDFVIMKATEGRTYKDPLLDYYYNLLSGRKDGKPMTDFCYGFYHYARPENYNTPVEEAYNFLRAVGHHAGNSIYALDVEGAALCLEFNRLNEWVYRWLECVRLASGVKPMLYCSASSTFRFPLAASADYGLWVASWYKKPTKKDIMPWKLYAIHQTDNGGGMPDQVDHDLFNGDAAAWRKYAAIVQ